ncbi:MAG: arginase [Chitinophagales bacterium]|jgi:arginase|nr:arginase [Chitinophagales bacterium]
MKPVKIIEIKSELGAGTRGASLGVDAIKIAALDFRSDYFKRYNTIEVKNENALLFEAQGSPFAKRIKGIYQIFDRLSTTVAETMKNDEFPIVLAGDHSTAAATISGIKIANPKARLGVIWIDAHADLHSPYTTPSGNVHGMPVAICLGEDNLDKQINKLDKETNEYWEKLKNIGGISPKILPRDIVYVCLRDYEKQEEHIIKKNKIKVVPTAEVRRMGTERVGRDILIYLDHCDIIYITFDVDSMDSSISKGTGTPVPGGINEREAGDLIIRLLQSEKICCFEMTEVNPTLDKENLMAENAFEILQKATNEILAE